MGHFVEQFMPHCNVENNRATIQQLVRFCSWAQSVTEKNRALLTQKRGMRTVFIEGTRRLDSKLLPLYSKMQHSGRCPSVTQNRPSDAD